MDDVTFMIRLLSDNWSKSIVDDGTGGDAVSGDGLNAFGHALPGLFEQKNLDLDKFNNLLKMYPDVKTILFCGNHGDPMMHPKIFGKIHGYSSQICVTKIRYNFFILQYYFYTFMKTN